MTDAHGSNNEFNSELEDSAIVGQPSYQGYEYQILATVWVALDLMAKGRAEAVVVEPPTAEDVSTEILQSESEGDWGIKAAEIQIQIKLRQHAIWQPKQFNELLKARTKKGVSGPMPRIRPLEFLEEKASRFYVLLTNADVNKSLASYRIDEIGEPSVAKRIPHERTDRSNIACRIGVLPPLTSEHLKAKIREILQRSYHVPGDHLNTCIEELLDVVRKRLLGELENRLSKAELLHLIRQQGGSYREQNEPIHSVKHGLITEHLNKLQALVLVGSPGTGKTTLAEWIVSGLESAEPPFRRVSGEECKDLTKVRKLLASEENHVFYYEDPWGQVPTNEESLLTSELPKLMRLARPGKVFVVTSRLSVFKSAVSGQKELYSPFVQQLEPEDYASDAYQAILDREIRNWETEKRKLLGNWRSEALKHLQTPYSIQIFVRLVSEELGKGTHLTHEKVEALARESNVGAFGAVLKRSLATQGPDQIAAAIALRAQLVARNRKITGSDPRMVRQVLRDGGISCPPDVMKLFNMLAEGRWLQARSDGYVATPSVVEALGMFEADEPAIYFDTLNALFIGWANSGYFGNILSYLKETVSANAIIQGELAERVDQYLVNMALSKEDYHFSYACHDLARYSTTDHPVALLARSLERIPTNGNRRPWYTPAWEPPALTTEQIRVIADSYLTHEFMKLFIKHRLPEVARHRAFGGFYVAETFIGFLRQFNLNLTPSIKDAYLTSVRDWEEGTTFLAECACILDPAFISTVVDESIEAYINYQASDDSLDDGYRKASQGEMDAATAEARYSEPPDSYFHAEEALRVSVKIKKCTDGFEWIVTHKHVKLLLEPWAECLNQHTPLSELQALAACCEQHHNMTPIYDAINHKLYIELLPWLVKQLFSKSTLLIQRWRQVIETYITEPTFLDLVRVEAEAHKESHRALIALELQRRIPIQEDVDGSENANLPDLWRAIVLCIVSEQQREMVVRCLKPSEKRLTEMQKKTLRVFVEDWDEWPGILAVQALATAGEDVAADLLAYFDSEIVEVRKLAFSVCGDESYLLSKGLSDVDFSCRMTSLRVLADNASPAVRHELFKLSTDASCYVREALAREIGNFKWSEGIPFLVKLLSDNRDYTEYHSGGDTCRYDVARTACFSLNEFDALSDETLDAIELFLEKCESSSRDTSVHGLLFRVLEQHPCSKTAAFFSRYVTTTWWDSKWNENRGQALIPAALNSLIQILLRMPELAAHVDTTALVDFVGLNDDNACLGAPAIVIIGLMHELDSKPLSEIMEFPSFDVNRAILMHAVCPKIRDTQGLKDWVPLHHPFCKILSWISESANANGWSEFLGAHPDVARWIGSLDQGGYVSSYTKWAVDRLLTKSKIIETRNDLPEYFQFTAS